MAIRHRTMIVFYTSKEDRTKLCKTVNINTDNDFTYPDMKGELEKRYPDLEIESFYISNIFKEEKSSIADFEEEDRQFDLKSMDELIKIQSYDESMKPNSNKMYW